MGLSIIGYSRRGHSCNQYFSIESIIMVIGTTTFMIEMIHLIPKSRRKEFDIGRTLWIPEWLKSEWMVHQQRSTNIRIGSITIITSPCFLLSEEHCIQGSRGKVLNNPLLCYDFMMKTMFLIWFHVENNVFLYDFMLKIMFSWLQF